MSDNADFGMGGSGRRGFAHNNNDNGGSRGGFAPSRGRGGFPPRDEPFPANANRVPLGQGRGGFPNRADANNQFENVQAGEGYAATRGRGGFHNRDDGNNQGGGGFSRGFVSRGGFNQDRAELGRGRGGFSNRDESFSSNANRVPLGQGRGGFPNRYDGNNQAGGGYAATRGRGGFPDRADGNNQGGGGFSRGFASRGGFNQDRAELGRGRGGYSETRGSFARRNDNEGTAQNADAEEPIQDDAERPRLRPRFHNSMARDVAELYIEDEQAATNYADIGDHDEDLVVQNFDEPSVQMQRWEEATLDPQVLQNVKERSHYSRLRKIQSVAIPFILDTFDVVAQSETGSGKTATYLIPIIDNCLKDKASQEIDKFESKLVTPYAIIIGPTREFVLQVFEQARKFADGTSVSVAKAYGQLEINHNWRELRRGCDILVATPGRLKDFVTNGHIFVKGLRVLVLDEADRLLDYKFSTEILEIVRTEGFPGTNARQTLLFTATFTDDVKQISKLIMKEKALLITNRRVDANKRIKQNFVVAGIHQRLDKLVEILKAEAEKAGGIEKLPRTLIFVNTKRMSDLTALYLCQSAKIHSTSINSDRPQYLREQALKDFRNHKVYCLVATDVCCRGIDIKGLDHVINLELPETAKEYIYRIGRTGRITQGYATTFVSHKEPLLTEIAQMMVRNGEKVPDTLNDIIHEDDDIFSLGHPEMCSTPLFSAAASALDSDDNDLF